MDGYKRSLLEKRFPIKLVSSEARSEKDGHPLLFDIHQWWNPTPLIIARAAVLASSLPENFDIEKFNELLGFRDYDKKQTHKYGLNFLQKRNLDKILIDYWDLEKPTVLDPFAGYGSIPFESFRMGFNTYSNDNDYLAYLIQNAIIKYPHKYGDKLLEDVTEGLNWLYLKLEDDLKDIYPLHNGVETANYIHSWVIKCPQCGFNNPLVSQWWLVRRGEKRLYLEPQINGDNAEFIIKNEGKPVNGTVINGKVKCLKCGELIPQKHVKQEILNKEDERILATITLGEEGKEYHLPTSTEVEIFNNIKSGFKEIEFYLFEEDLLPQGKITISCEAGIYLDNWSRLLNSRQRTVFASLIRLTREYQLILTEIMDEEYVSAIIIYMSFALGKHFNKNCRSSKYDRRRENVTGAITEKGIPFLWDHNETNPFSESSGSLKIINENILNGLEYSIEMLRETNDEYLELEIQNNQISESALNAPIIVTKPPCLDDIDYSELNNFFYIIENLALRNITESNHLTIETDNSIINKTGEEITGIYDSFKKLYQILDDDGILVIYIDQSDLEKWDLQFSLLIKNGFKITATWPIRISTPKNPLQQYYASLESQLIIVARKKLEEQKVYLKDVIDELNIYLNEKRLPELWNYKLKGMDFTIAALGAVCDYLTPYTVINDFNKEITFNEILLITQKSVTRYILNKVLDYPMKLDKPTLFYLYCRVTRLDGMSFDTADLIIKSIDTDLESLKNSGIIKINLKGPKKGVKLLKYYERQDFNSKYLINSIHRLMKDYQNNNDDIYEFESSLKISKYTTSEIYNILSAFKYFRNGDLERLTATKIIRESTNISV